MRISGMTKKGMVSALAEVTCLLVLLVVAVGCGSNSGDDPPRDGMTMGEVDALMRASNGVDTDGDYLPDDVELALGTDPYSPDSDMDGMFDYGEVFSGDYSGPGDLVPDYDYDGVIAALDPDDDGDGLHDGDGVDSDGDGIANYLEYFGYTYNWVMDEYNLWDGEDNGVLYYKSDPMQPSTDQDPYSDGMESSGVLLDVLIKAPGDLPMVPAYPNIVVRLEGYDVTLDSEISYSHGGSIGNETSWSREMSVEHAFEAGMSFEVGAEAKVGALEWLTLSTKAGVSFSASQTVSSTSSIGESVTQESNWNKAVSSNPATAARVKLKLKVYNFGTAAASNIVPTLTMKIGGMSVLTFTPETPIGILEPGGAYPASDSTYWVVDRTGGGEVIHLTMDELRALESGTPLNIEVTQMDGDVMLLDDQGQWASAGKWGEYMARCEAVCANIKLDIGDGNFIHQLVYADDSPFTPRVTLGDALAWIAYYEERLDGGFIKYFDKFGMLKETSLTDWNFIFDRHTLVENGLLPASTDPADAVEITDIVLNQDSVLIGRAPREVLDILNPEIYYAYYDVKDGLTHVRAGDYNGITEAWFVDIHGAEHAMSEVLPNSGVFVFDAGALEEGTYEPTYFSDGLLEETVRVVNRDGDSKQQRFAAAYQPDKPDSPIDIVNVSVDEANNTVIATLKHDPYFPPTSVDVYFDGSVEALSPHPMNWHPDYEDKWIYVYNATDYSPADFIDAWIIAEVSGVDCENLFDPYVQTDYSSDCFATYQIEESDIDDSACVSGGFTLNGHWSTAVVALISRYDVVDFDAGAAPGSCSLPQVDTIQEDVSWLAGGFNQYGAQYDLEHLAGYGGGCCGSMEARYHVYEVDDSTAYAAINESNIEGTANLSVEVDPTFYDWLGELGNWEEIPNAVYILKTSAGRWVKLKLNRVYGTGYAVHWTSHSDISYAVYNVDP